MNFAVVSSAWAARDLSCTRKRNAETTSMSPQRREEGRFLSFRCDLLGAGKIVHLYAQSLGHAA